MKSVYNLGLPSSSDVNMTAHPGGGTQVTESTREGLVEDLFEAHLKYLDVATRSAVLHRLAALADSIDGFANVSSLDQILVTAASYAESGQVTAEELKKNISATIGAIKNLMMAAGSDSRDPLPSPGFKGPSERLAGNVVDELDQVSRYIDSNQLDLALATAKHLMSEEIMTGGRYDITSKHIDELLHDQELKVYENRVAILISNIESLANLASGPANVEESRTREEPVPQVAGELRSALDDFAAEVEAMYQRYDSVDRATDNLASVDPAMFKDIDRKIAAIKGVSHLAQLEKLRATVSDKSKLYSLPPAFVTRYRTVLAQLDGILKQAEAVLAGG